MSPKEKSEELVDKFLPHSMYYIHDLTPNYVMKKEQRENAIECALICTNEILSQWNNEQGRTAKQKYWLEVKKELEVF